MLDYESDLGVGEGKDTKNSNGLKYMKKYKIKSGLWKLVSTPCGKVLTLYIYGDY